jgi:DNA-directed RNA polymerase specialized sigma24 family protein
MLAQDDYSATAPMKDFETRWRELSRGLHTRLVSRGVPRWVADDIVQETGFRLFRMWDRVDHNGAVWGLAITIANNLLWDQRNRGSAREMVGEIPDAPAPHDVETIGLARLELMKAQRLMAELSPQHRSVLLAEIGEGGTPASTSPDALKMIRMRARRRLGALMEHASSFGFVCWFGGRELARRSSDFLRRHGVTVEAQAAATTTASFIVAFAIATSTMPSPAAAAPGGSSISRSQMLAAAAEHMAEPTVTLEREAGDASRGAPKAPEPGPGSDDGYIVTFGDEDGPAHGDAGVGVEDDEDGFQPSAPECESGADPDEYEVHARCSIETPGGTVSGGGGVDINP